MRTGCQHCIVSFAHGTNVKRMCPHCWFVYSEHSMDDYAPEWVGDHCKGSQGAHDGHCSRKIRQPVAYPEDPVMAGRKAAADVRMERMRAARRR